MKNITKQNLENCTLAQLERIAANQFRSADNTQDYCPFEVEERMLRLKIKKAQKMAKMTEVEPIIMFDSQLSGLMSVSLPGKHLLALIDAALKSFEVSAPKDAEILEGKEIDLSWNGNLSKPVIFGFYGPDVFGNEVYFSINKENERDLWEILETELPRLKAERDEYYREMSYEIYNEMECHQRSKDV